MNLHVFFAQGKAADRSWKVSLEKFDFDYTILQQRTVRLGGAAQLIDPALFSRLRGINFDVVILGDNRQTVLSGLMITLVARAHHRPFIVWTGTTPGEARVAHSARGLQWTLAKYRRGLFSRAAAIVAYGTATQRYLAEQGIPRHKIFAGAQVVPDSQLPPPAMSRTELGLDGETVFLSVNYMLPGKGLDVLIKAFQRVAGRHDRLVLVGSGPAEKSLRRLAGGDSRIWFTGYQEGPYKTAWYTAADVFVFPTLHDSWGLVVNEAMAFGLPIIATEAAGCTADLVSDNGLIVPAADVDAMAEALVSLGKDATLRRQMGLRSRAIIAEFTVERACSTFREAIRYALERTR